jgi:ABC-type dipeptide/oligopeptide/nickel transport system ATPase subunit
MDKIEEARAKLPLPELMREMGYGEFAKSSVKSPFRDEKSPSWGIYEKAGRWKFLDHGTGEGGDEIDFIEQVENIDRKAAIKRFCDMAGVRSDPQKQSQTSKPTEYALSGSKSIWDRLHKSADNDFLSKLAESRGLTFEVLEWAHQDGILGNNGGMPAFVCGEGAHCKAESGAWYFMPKGIECEPLTFGDRESRDIYVFESQWDALAIADAIGVEEAAKRFFVVTRGANNGKMAGRFAAGKNVYAFPQNDEAKNGKIPSEIWWKDVAKACEAGAVLRVSTPTKHKDANVWIKEGATKATVISAIQSAFDPVLATVEVQTYGQLFKYVPEEDKTQLLGNRWVCQGGQLLLVGQSGIGKSSLSVQAAMTWALGMPFFGINPKKQIRSLFIQAENDIGDMAEIVQGVMRHVYDSAKINKDVAGKLLTENIHFARVTAHVGDDFPKVVGRLLDRYGEKDLVFVDPLLSYVGGDISRQEVMSHFLRQLCNPIAFERRFAWVFSHHTGKPQSDSKARQHWNANDYAYIGMGSSELTNWARAIAVLQTTKHDGIFKLLLAKRGKRANVVDEFGQAETEIILKHASSGLHWEPARIPEDPPENKKGPGAPSKMNELIYAEICAFIETYDNSQKDLKAQIEAKWNICYKTFTNYSRDRAEKLAGKK